MHTTGMCLRRLTLGVVLLGGAAGACSAVEAQQGPAIQPRWKTGETVPSFEGVGLNGSKIIIDFTKSKKPTLIYLITPRGPMVQRNEQMFNALVRQAANSYDVYVVSTQDGGLADYIKEIQPEWKGARVTVVGGINEETKLKMRFGGYPSTLVVSNESKALLSFGGQYLDDRAKLVEEFFKIKLPPVKK